MLFISPYSLLDDNACMCNAFNGIISTTHYLQGTFNGTLVDSYIYIRVVLGVYMYIYVWNVSLLSTLYKCKSRTRATAEHSTPIRVSQTRSSRVPVRLLRLLQQLPPSVYDLVDGGLLVAGAGNDVLVVRRDVAAKHRGRLLRLQGKPKRKDVMDVKRHRR